MFLGRYLCMKRTQSECPTPLHEPEHKSLHVSHRQLQSFSKSGGLTSLGDFIRLDDQSTALANAGKSPYLLLCGQDATLPGESISLQYIYRAMGHCHSACFRCHVELHNGWFNYPSDAAILWCSEEEAGWQQYK